MRQLSCRRSFVSTVLLARTWELSTVVELRKEAKARGLSTRGNKASLIARIQEYENTPARHASTVPKTVQAASPGIPLPAHPHNTSPNAAFLAIKLPAPSLPLPVTPVQVPYVPDFWNSARPNPVLPSEPDRQKLHVVGGSATHYDGGPTHNLEKHLEVDSPSIPAQTHHVSAPADIPAFWADLWESLGLPRSFSARRALVQASHLAEQHAPQTRSRPLTDEERRGLYILFGIIGGSWLVGGLLNRPNTASEVHSH